MKLILSLLLVATITTCNAQQNNKMDDNEQLCGGYRSDYQSTVPLENVKGELTKLFCTFYDDSRGENNSLMLYDINLNDTVFSGSITEAEDRKRYKFNVKKDTKTVQILTQALKESGLLKFNKWNVYVNGLPPITEFSIIAEFSSGEHYFMEFNGGHSPNGFMEAVKVFNDAVCKAAGQKK